MSEEKLNEVNDKENEVDSSSFNHGKITLTEFSQEMRTSFLEYSMSVIVARALPDARDGMKPVHRRIVYGMNDLGMTPDKPHKKSARIVGDVMGRFHPHGDSAIYGTMVRMAQDFSYRYPLVDGHGNFGSIDGDGAAAMRYTEARMSKISLELVRDINKDTIDWIDTYQGDEKEPVVLPARFPNLLANGNQGIAVGMATNIPPHNLKELIDGCIALMDNPDIETKELMGIIKGPDFPTGGIIVGRSGIKSYFETGKGTVITRSRIETKIKPNGKAILIVSEIPYMVNKSVLVAKVAELVREKVIDGITALTDTSNMNGIHIEIELRKDAQPDVILNQLYRLSPLQSSFAVNNIVLVNNVPQLLGMKALLNVYTDHQIDVVTRRTRYDLKKAQDRAHILEGFRIAIDNIDAVIHTIRSCKGNDDQLTNELMEKFKLSQAQAKAILSMQLRRLSGLERDKIEAEYNELLARIANYQEILADVNKVKAIVKQELLEIRNKYGDNRRSEIIEGSASMEDEDLIAKEEIVVTLTSNGYFKRLPLDTYRVQNRGGRGIKGMSMNEDDMIEQFVSMNTHDFLLVFTNKGRVYRMKGYNVPLGSRISKGIPIVNFLSLEKGEKVRTLLPIQAQDSPWHYLCFATVNGLIKKTRIEEFDSIRTGGKEKGEKVRTLLPIQAQDSPWHYLCFATVNGLIKKTRIEEFDSIRTGGKIAIVLRDDDELLTVIPSTGNDEIVIAGSNGKAVRFNESDVRDSGRTSMGVKGFNVDGGKAIGMTSNALGQYVFTVSANGIGKMSDLSEYRLSKRGGKGVMTTRISEKTGDLTALVAINGNEDALLMSDGGIMIRIDLNNLRPSGRATQGVKLMNLNDGEHFANLAIVLHEESDSQVIIMIRIDLNNLRPSGRATQGVKLMNLNDGEHFANLAIVLHEESDSQVIDESQDSE